MMKAKTIMADCVTMSSLRLLTWSAMTPPMSAKSRIGELQHQPALGDVLHPGADVGEEIAGPEEAEVTMAESASKARNLNDGGFSRVSNSAVSQAIDCASTRQGGRAGIQIGD